GRPKTSPSNEKQASVNPKPATPLLNKRKRKALEMNAASIFCSTISHQSSDKKSEGRVAGSAGVPPAVSRILRDTPERLLACEPLSTSCATRDTRNTARGTPALPEDHSPVSSGVRLFVRDGITHPPSK